MKTLSMIHQMVYTNISTFHDILIKYYNNNLKNLLWYEHLDIFQVYIWADPF